MGQVRGRGKKGTRYLADLSSYDKFSDHPGARAVLLAYVQKGPCTWKEAMDYAQTLPDATERSTLESWDARLKHMGIIVPEEDAAPQEGTPSQEDGRATEPAPVAVRVGFWEHRERRQLDRDLAKADLALVVAEDLDWDELRKLAEQRRRSLLEARRKG
ncbi:MAG: hypothetical protein V3U45_06005 [bacterium]